MKALLALTCLIGSHHPLNFLSNSTEDVEEMVEDEEVDIIVIEDEEKSLLSS